MNLEKSLPPADAPPPSTTPIVWPNVILAAVLMLATLPGRSQGLGLINEPLLAALQISRADYGSMNFWATLLGAAFCLPIGWLLDRCGLRWVSTALVLALGAVVWRMAAFAGGHREFFILILLTRGFGQSALSVASITTVGKSAGEKSGFAMGLFSVLFTLFIAAAFVLVGAGVKAHGWRFAWGWVAAGLLLGVAPLVAWLLREPPAQPAALAASTPTDSNTGHTLSQALRTKAFWTFSGAIALFGLAVSGLGFWNESVLARQGFDAETAAKFFAGLAGFGLLGQFASGWLSKHWSLARLLGASMALYGLGLATLPLVRGWSTLLGAAALFGLSGGAISVVFFALWSAAFGRTHLGRIQGAAQLLTVVASALGPWLFAQSLATFGSYVPLLLILAPLVFLFALASWRLSASVPVSRSTK